MASSVTCSEIRQNFFNSAGSNLSHSAVWGAADRSVKLYK